MTPLVSLVIPVLDDFDAAARLLAGLPPESGVEIIIADGGADANLDGLVAGRPDTRIVRSRRGRAAQMNAGAATAAGTWLLFVHADSRMPPGWRGCFDTISSDVVGGWFAFALDDTAWQARMIERGVRWRVRVLHLPYGDQGLFVRRDVFERMRGYRDLPLMEDVEFVRRLHRQGRCVELPFAMATSSRRWRRDGWLRRSVRNLALVTLYFAGVSPTLLGRWYGTRR